MSQDAPVGIGEKVGVTLLAADGRVKQRVLYPPTAPTAKFCPRCGERLGEVTLQVCKVCGRRYVTSAQIVDGKLISALLDLGVE